MESERCNRIKIHPFFEVKMIQSEWLSKSGRIKLDKLSNIILDYYRVGISPTPSALFVRDNYTGFRIFCSMDDLPSKNPDRRKESFQAPRGPHAGQEIMFVARCRWLWDPIRIDLIGVSLLTDIAQAKHPGIDKMKRLKQQNRPADVAWSKEKINMLWKIGSPMDEPPLIFLESPYFPEYIDHGDYL